MATASSGKTCVVCGSDCAGKPRVKDPAGRYFCRGCYEQAKRKRASPDAGVSPGAGAFSTPSKSAIHAALQHELGATATPGESADDLFAIHPELAAAEIAPHVEMGRTCPQCAQPLPIGSVLCVHCGFDTRTGHAVAITKIKRSIAPNGSGGATAWPIVVGVISIVLGAGGVLANGFSLLTAVAKASGATNASYSIGSLAGALIATLLSIWLSSAGIGIVRRRQSGVVAIRRWAITKMVLYGTCLGGAGIALLAMPGATGSLPRELGGGGPGLIVVVFIAVLAWFFAWPLFVLHWFGRDSVQEEVNRWM